MSNSIVEIEDTKCLFIFGWNPADSHPIIARRVVKAKEKGATIIVCDPRKIETARIADLHVPLKNGSNVAFVNALMNVIINEGLADKEFIERYTTGFEELKAIVDNYPPEAVTEITGIDAETIRKTARMVCHCPRGGGHLLGHGCMPVLSGCGDRTGTDLHGADYRQHRQTPHRSCSGAPGRTTCRAPATWARCPMCLWATRA